MYMHYCTYSENFGFFSLHGFASASSGELVNFSLDSENDEDILGSTPLVQMN